MVRILLLTALAASLALGCQPTEAAPARPSTAPAPPKPKRPPPPPPSPPAPQPQPQPQPQRTDYDLMRFHMHANFDLLRAIERLLIRGKLDDARRFAEALSAGPDAPAHGPWATHSVTVRDRAATLARATTIDDACAKVARLSAACAGCHVEAALAPEFKAFPPTPPDKPTVEARMLRHRWAADRLWEGIVGGAEEPWRAGLDVLAAPALAWETFAPGRAAYGRQLRQLATTARRNKRLGLDGRATAYGAMLATCAACHTAPTK